jgi:hypothetical protein
VINSLITNLNMQVSKLDYDTIKVGVATVLNSRINSWESWFIFNLQRNKQLDTKYGAIKQSV